MSQEPTEKDIEKAAQCWCDPRTSNTEMDSTLARVFAEKLAAEREEAKKTRNIVTVGTAIKDQIKIEGLEKENKQLEREIIWAERDNRKLEQKLIEWDRFNKSVTEKLEKENQSFKRDLGQALGVIDELKESLRQRDGRIVELEKELQREREKSEKLFEVVKGGRRHSVECLRHLDQSYPCEHCDALESYHDRGSLKNNQKDAPEVKCSHPDIWFDREIYTCSHGVEGMHNVCSRCGECADKHQKDASE